MPPGPDDHPNVPERIPTGPDVDLSFDALAEREHLGSGGAADVVKMSVAGTDAVVAVKQPRAERTLRSEAMAAFVEEANLWAELGDIDHVVGVAGRGETPVPWLALEYMDGGSLADRRADLSLEAALWTATCVADGVLDAHRRGVRHHDLKPGNVLFRSVEGAWDVPKVSDWGGATRVESRSAGREDFSPRYAAPEQLASDGDRTPDHRTDVYQLGTVVYELLTGEPLFAGRAATVTRRHLAETPEPPTSVDPSLPAAVDDVVGTALEKDPSDRYESMLDFERELTALFGSVAGDGGRSRGTTGADGRTDRGNGSGEAGAESWGGPDGGFDDVEPGVLDSIQERSAEERTKEFPWQHRSEPPGLDDDEDERGAR